MKPHLVIASLLVAAGLASPAVVATDSRALAPAPKGAAERPRLQPGMSAETVLALIGKPSAITPVHTAAGAGERWTYRRIANRDTTLDPVTVQALPVFDGAVGPTSDIGTEMAPVYHVKNVVTHQVTALLMVDGKLIMAKQWQERNRSYAD